ncbi:MAG: fumarate hydratase [Candidatus Cloacimonas sp.]|jgi:fumarate hydratase subunit alpha|nr:fumarate hydratase [Candidatus Cloacimonas sp.]
MAYRYLSAEEIETRLIEAIGEITYRPDPAIKPALLKAYDHETEELPRDVLASIIANIEMAPEDKTPLCQDTGTFIVLAYVGNELIITGQPLQEIVNNALIKASAKFYLRSSILSDPLYQRINTGNNAPAILHIRIVKGDSLVLHIAQKGGGAENKSRLKMFNPSATDEDIIQFAVDTVILAGAQACPPLILGIGIGGNFETCALLAKQALFVPLNQAHANPLYAELEEKILNAINKTRIGTQGMGGNCTSLAVHIAIAPCHIASLPVAINLQCHAHRHCEIVF